MLYADESCTTCHGAGVIIVDAMSSRRCDCFKRGAFRDAVGDTVYRAARVSEPMLLKAMTKNVYLVGDPAATNAALRFVLARLFLGHNLIRTWVEVTDETLTDIRLPGEHTTAEKESYERSMECEFLVLHIGARKRNHSWFSSSLVEALEDRKRRTKPTWIVMDHVLAKSDCAYSESLERAIQKDWPMVKYKIATVADANAAIKLQAAQRYRTP